MPRPQWYEELLKQRRREETIVESNLEQTATRSDKNDMRTMNAKKDSPDIIMLLDENYEPRKGAKSGRRASSFIPAPDFFDSNTKISSKSDELKLPIDDFLILTKERKSVLFEKESTAKRSSLCAKDLELVDVDESECADFFIPEMPEGQQMIIELRSNWGDDDFIGLNGIEIFDAKTANVAKIEKAFCETDPQSDVSVLFDGVYRTHDNSHIWLQTFTPPASIKIKIKFSERITVLLLRVWNYNKSRIYSERGVRQMLITLDDKLIFKGEIAKAYGELKGPPERFGDVSKIVQPPKNSSILLIYRQFFTPRTKLFWKQSLSMIYHLKSSFLRAVCKYRKFTLSIFIILY
ncbi:uncharacterized protein B4U79_14460 [Dinothrombium tinctorium]|uniref:KATNIP domain-containing protein n=1 Tax=Dinothrombium tinctorium TaxID=1965070 RepID=A0A3S3PLV6_9ACAR|nr:uncharacterized protein B4U79_14460 [Dinothrombium tinctorium]